MKNYAAKAQLKGSLMLGLESSTARMSNLARQEMYYDHFHTMDEIIAKIEAVTREEVWQWRMTSSSRRRSP